MAKKRNLFELRRYSRKSVRRDREYGFFWYDWLWQILRPVLVLLCAFLVVVGIVAMGWEKLYIGLIAPTDEYDTSSYAFTISSGESVSTIAQHLEEQEFVASGAVFKYYVQFYGLTNKLQSGVYYISRSMDVFEIANNLAGGNATNERTIRIIPGWTVEDIADYLVEVGALDTRAEFLKVCTDYKSSLGYSLALIEADESTDLSKRAYPLEGYLAPDTYRVYLTADAASIARTLIRQTDTVYTAVFTHEPTYNENGDMTSEAAPYGAKGVELSEDEIIILASIIEKEAGSYEDMQRVSAVFYNRLAKGMKLESCATVTYLTGITRIALTDSDLQLNSPYNTYLVSGLPVGPICNPSKNAILAALNPDETYLNEEYLYFCTAEPTGGKLVFAKTQAEHEANTAKYRPPWEEYDRQNAG